MAIGIRMRKAVLVLAVLVPVGLLAPNAAGAPAPTSAIHLHGTYRIVSTDCYFLAGSCQETFKIYQVRNKLYAQRDRYFHGSVKGEQVSFEELYPQGVEEDSWWCTGSTTDGGATITGTMTDGIGGSGTFVMTRTSGSLSASVLGAGASARSTSGVRPPKTLTGQRAAPRCTTVLRIKSLVFSPPSAAPGYTSTAEMSALNCTSSEQSASVTWLASFVPGASGRVEGCPVLDPVAEPLTFRPHSSAKSRLTYSVPVGCTAGALDATARLTDQAGDTLATKTASLTISP